MTASKLTITVTQRFKGRLLINQYNVKKAELQASVQMLLDLPETVAVEVTTTYKGTSQ